MLQRRANSKKDHTISTDLKILTNGIARGFNALLSFCINDDALETPTLARRPRRNSCSSCNGECRGCMAAHTGVSVSDSDSSTDDHSDYDFYSPDLPQRVAKITASAMETKATPPTAFDKNVSNLNTRQELPPLNLHSTFGSSSAPVTIGGEFTSYTLPSALPMLPLVRATSTLTILQIMRQHNLPASKRLTSANEDIESNTGLSARVSAFSSSPNKDDYQTTDENSENSRNDLADFIPQKFAYSTYTDSPIFALEIDTPEEELYLTRGRSNAF